MPLAILMAFVAAAVLIHILVRGGKTLDAAEKKLDGDPEWQKGLGNGVIENLLRDEDGR